MLDLSFLLGYAVFWFLSPIPLGVFRAWCERCSSRGELQRRLVPSSRLVPLLGLNLLFWRKHLTF